MKIYEFEEWLIDESNLFIFCCTDDPMVPFLDKSGDDGCSIDELISNYDDLIEKTHQKQFVSDEGFARAHIRAFFAEFDVSSRCVKWRVGKNRILIVQFQSPRNFY